MPTTAHFPFPHFRTLPFPNSGERLPTRQRPRERGVEHESGCGGAPDGPLRRVGKSSGRSPPVCVGVWRFYSRGSLHAAGPLLAFHGSICPVVNRTIFAPRFIAERRGVGIGGDVLRITAGRRLPSFAAVHERRLRAYRAKDQKRAICEPGVPTNTATPASLLRSEGGQWRMARGVRDKRLAGEGARRADTPGNIAS